jgi:hypothetical protein
MSAQNLEAFLARLYSDEQARSRFVANPNREARNAGLSAEDCTAMEKIDFVGLQLAADSFARKRAAHPPRKPASRIARWLQRD